MYFDLGTTLGKNMTNINDINKDIINLFRIFARFPTYLCDMLEFKVYSRAEFDLMLKQPPAILTDLERAVRFLYLQKVAFGGKVTGQSFGVSTDRGVRFDVDDIKVHIKELHHRLKKVVIECLPYQDLIARYDRDFSLFYLDSSYWDCEDDYGKGIFSKSDFYNMEKILAGIKGKFIMSINDVPEIRRIFKRFYIMEAKTTYTLSKDVNINANELLISNVDLNSL